MTPIRVLDSEMVSALAQPGSNKHRKALSYVEADKGARRRRSSGARWLVPTTVRVESGWDRSAPEAAIVNRLGIIDHPLAGAAADVAARLRTAHRVSPADAHVGAVIATQAGEDLTVFTSDVDDVAAVADGAPVRIIAI